MAVARLHEAVTGIPPVELVVSLMIWGDGACRALAQSQRLDTHEVLTFLRSYT